MVQRLQSLTDAQRDRMASFAQEWIEHGWRTAPLTEEEWRVVEDGMRRCYEHACVPWPNRVVRVSSPIVGALAAPAAQFAISLRRRLDQVLHGAVDGAVGDAVGGAVDDAVRDAVGQVIRNRWYYRFGGRLWPTWQAYVAYFRDVVNLDLDGDIWDRSRAYDDAQGAGWWWPFQDFVMVCEPPVELHLEQVGPTGWGSHRLHCETGPAVAWSDGWSLHFWHGTHVPAWVIENPTIEQAMAERNTEIRRCAFESLGWDKVLEQINERPIDICPDPANPPHELRLYKLPDRINPYPQPVNLLLMTNGSPDRNGVLRQYAETVPATITSAVAAAGWQYGINPSVYRQLERRT